MNFRLSLTLGLVFGFLAAILTFFIAYGEYRRQLLSPKRIWRESLTAAIFSCAVVLLSALALSYMLRRVL